MRDRTADSIVKETLHMAWPAVCESFFVSLAGMIDSLMVKLPNLTGLYSIIS